MPIQWDNDEMQLFFGCQPAPFDSDGLVSQQKTRDLLFLSYRGGSMNYKILFDSNEEVVFISGSFEEPFGADALFELTVRCDSITVVDDPYYSNQIGLLFHRGNPSGYQDLRMQIFKRPDGDLKVWPAPI